MSGFMDRWFARLKNDPKPIDSYADWQSEYDSELRAARSDTPPLPKVKVDPFTKNPVCPKCGNTGIFTAYFGGVHKDCPHLYMFDSKPEMEIMVWGRPSPRTVVARERIREAAVEHLDRRCFNCAYGWTTATAPVRKAKTVAA